MLGSRHVHRCDRHPAQLHERVGRAAARILEPVGIRDVGDRTRESLVGGLAIAVASSQRAQHRRVHRGEADGALDRDRIALARTVAGAQHACGAPHHRRDPLDAVGIRRRTRQPPASSARWSTVVAREGRGDDPHRRGVHDATGIERLVHRLATDGGDHADDGVRERAGADGAGHACSALVWRLAADDAPPSCA